MYKTFVEVPAVAGLVLTSCGSDDSGKAEAEPLTGDALFLSSLENQGLTGEYDDETANGLARTFSNGVNPVVSIVKGNTCSASM
ncbi:hypothetical protein BS297_18695 [Rhodococcus erythropolis]|jgi:hypothetical protein|uniref:Uncharacterized protein n=1 Tax=Rhodococcus erythropolis TaxID=1833 RepID=A0A5N5E139_RHOER|nr:hypothetical protein BS297_18695 [Rhodococcus erythropolis]